VIELTRFNGERFVLNADQIEMVEGAPDTVIRLLSGKKLLVLYRHLMIRWRWRNDKWLIS